MIIRKLFLICPFVVTPKTNLIIYDTENISKTYIAFQLSDMYLEPC